MLKFNFILIILGIAHFCSAKSTNLRRLDTSGGLLIPLYVWPTFDGNSCVDSNYKKVAQSAAAGTNIIAIVNPNNGPKYNGDTWMKDSYDACISYLKSNNVEVIGYVHTKTGYPNIDGYRTNEDIEEDINLWKSDYDVDGIFIDEVTNRWPDDLFDSKQTAVSVYQNIVDYIINDKNYGRVVMNPGGAYFEDLMMPYYGNSAVITVMFESPSNKYLPLDKNCLPLLWTPSQGQFSPGPWCPYVPNWDGVESLENAMSSRPGIDANQSAVMIYNAGSSSTIGVLETEQMIDIGIAENVGWFYVTDKAVWSDTPSQDIMDAQSRKLRSC